MSKESFVFYKSFYEAIKNVPEEEQLKLYKAICEYSFEGKDILPEGIAKAMFILIKPNLDSANARYEASVENGKKGGRPKKETQQKPKQNPDETQTEPNSNLNVNDNVDVDDNVNDNEEINNNTSKSDDVGQVNDSSDETLVDDFEVLWGLYPKKQGKNQAYNHYRAWLKGRKFAGKTKKLTREQMWYAITEYAEKVKTWDRQYIKDGSTFFNNAIYEYAPSLEEVAERMNSG